MFSMALSAVSKFPDVSTFEKNVKFYPWITLILLKSVVFTVTYLGIKISKDPKEVMNNNLSDYY